MSINNRKRDRMLPEGESPTGDDMLEPRINTQGLLQLGHVVN